MKGIIAESTIIAARLNLVISQGFTSETPVFDSKYCEN